MTRAAEHHVAAAAGDRAALRRADRQQARLDHARRARRRRVLAGRLRPLGGDAGPGRRRGRAWTTSPGSARSSRRGSTPGDAALIEALPEALATTGRVCGSVACGSTQAGINADAVLPVARAIKGMAARTADRDSIACAKFVAFCNAVGDNPFVAGAFHGPSEPGLALNVGISGPGRRAARRRGAGRRRRLRRGHGRRQDGRVQDHARRRARRAPRGRGAAASGPAQPRPVRRRRHLAGADAGRARLGRRRAQGVRTRRGRRAGHDGGARDAQRGRQARRADGGPARRRAERGVHAGERGPGHDRGGRGRPPDASRSSRP